MFQPHDTDRTIGDIARKGTIATIDRAAARVTVKLSDDAVTGPIRWASLAGAGLAAWVPPSVGEQVLLLCPEGEIAAAVAVLGLYSDANPAPADDDAYSLHFGDGAVIRYDAQESALTIVLPDGGTMAITAPGGLTITADMDITGDVSITGDLSVDGEITATGDVTGDGISLEHHVHSGVDSGSSNTGEPV